MRLLHTSDWHLGVQTHGHPRISDHDAVIAEIQAIAEDFKPDLILHTGDVWHVSRPAEQEIQRGINAFVDLAAIAPVVVVRGNHDNRALFTVFQTLLATISGQRRVTFVPRPRRPAGGGILEFESTTRERIRLASLPFISAGQAVDPFDEEQSWTGTYTDAVREVEIELGAGLEHGYTPAHDVLLFAAHLHVHGARWSKNSGEREVTVQEDYATLPDHIPTVSYAAFGHIHIPQELPGGMGRYAGSPLQIDFGEEGQEKSVVLVEAKPSKPAHVWTVPLRGARRLYRITCPLSELDQHAATIGNGMVLVRVESDDEVDSLADEVRKRLPQAHLLDCIPIIRNRTTVLATEVPDADEEPPLDALYAEYINRRGLRRASAQAVVDTFRRALAAVRAQETFNIEEVDRVRAALALADEVADNENRAAQGAGDEEDHRIEPERAAVSTDVVR
jgi:DNA repair protein SbcD/Mre11